MAGVLRAGPATFCDDGFPQPAVRRVGLHAGMPHGRDHDLGCGHGKLEALKARCGCIICRLIIFEIAARDESDEIGVAGDLHGIAEARYDNGCRPLESQFF